MFDSNLNPVAFCLEEDHMSGKSEFERTIILDILAKDRLEGLPIMWLKSKLEQILDGAEPNVPSARRT